MERKKSVAKDKNESDLNLNEKVRVAILIILHLVGIIGFSLPEYVDLFQWVTPFHLLVISIVLLFEKAVLDKGFALFFGLCFFIGFGAEVLGVKTGLLFGYYAYSNVLGFKFLDVPLALGLLWATTAYAANEMANKMINGIVPKVVVAALIMVLFDYLLEPFAVNAGLWKWNSSTIPNYNYISWFIVGLVMSIIYQTSVKIKYNKVAPFFLIIQVVFFLLYQLINGLLPIGFW